jgi:predicted transcriptional regulator
MHSDDAKFTNSRDSSRYIESTQRIFFELASDQRLSILFKLNRQESEAGVYNLSKLAKHLDVTMQEVHRNLNRLMDAGLIEKDSAGIFSLTTFGNTIINQIATFDFLSRNKEYFSTHTFGKETRMKFIQRIGALNNC